MSIYEKLPPLQTLHAYDDCLSGPDPSPYCLIFAEIQPDATSELWHNIAYFSEDKFHRFRHDYLHFGLCVRECKNILEKSMYDIDIMAEPDIPENQVS